jgi:hypothetical protein
MIMLPLLLLLCAASLTAAPPPNSPRPWLDAALPIPKRVQLLMAQMTLEEKGLQLLHTSIGIDPRLPTVQAKIKAGGMGAMTIEANAPENGTSCGAECRIGRLRQLQLAFLNGTRLGIPLSFVIETSHCGAAGGTIFPMGVTQGASWNTSLAHDIGAAIAREARAWGGDRGLSPEINAVTDPRFGMPCMRHIRQQRLCVTSRVTRRGRVVTMMRSIAGRIEDTPVKPYELPLSIPPGPSRARG